jgi:hypothetical protein
MGPPPIPVIKHRWKMPPSELNLHLKPSAFDHRRVSSVRLIGVYNPHYISM